MIDEACVSKLSELFSKTISQPKNPNLQNLQYYFEMIDKIGKGFVKVKIIRGSLRKKEKKLTNSLSYAVTFLFVFEGLYVSLLDCVIFLLICDGHDLFDPIKRRFVHTPDEIEQVDVATKFRFLEEHGFESLILKDDQIIRNKIAHNDFELYDKSPKVIIDGKQRCLASKLNSLVTFVNNLMDTLARLSVIDEKAYSKQ